MKHEVVRQLLLCYFQPLLRKLSCSSRLNTGGQAKNKFSFVYIIITTLLNWPPTLVYTLVYTCVHCGVHSVGLLDPPHTTPTSRMPSLSAPTLEQILQAVENIQGKVIRSPLVRFQGETPGLQAEVWLKLENLQPTGWRKVTNKSSLSPQELSRCVLLQTP